MKFPAAQCARFRLCAQGLVAVLCLILLVQGAHVCGTCQSLESSLQAGFASPNLVCPVCVVAHALLFTVSFLLLFFMLGNAPIFSNPVKTKKSLWREVRLYMRPPPAL